MTWMWIDDVRRDVAFAWRMLCRNRGFATVAVLTLAIGISVNTVVFTVTNAVLFKGFPLVEHNERLVYITSGRGCCVSYPDFEDWQAQAKSFAGMALVHGVPATLSEGGAGSELLAATEITANTFRLVGQRPIVGRDFARADEQPGAPLVLLLRYELWQHRFGADPHIVGRTMRVNGRAATVIGVMPRGFSFPQNQDLWMPLVATADVRRRDVRDTWFVLGRLSDGVTVEHARAEMTAIGQRLGAAYPATNQGRNLLPLVSTFEDFFIGAGAGAVYRAMWGAVAFVLLIACANQANLLLARARLRSREICVRMAIGAGRWRVVRQLLIESLMLSAMGGLVGWWMARWGVAVYAAAANGSGISEETFGVWFIDVLDYSMDYRAFVYLAAISVGTALVFGLLPALRLSNLDVNGGLKDGGRGVTSDARARRVSWALVAAEMMLAVVLVAGAGVLLRSFLDIYRADPGFDAADVTSTLISLPRSRYAGAEAQRAFFDRLTARLEGGPGIERMATASALPGWNLAPRSFDVEGVSAIDPQQRPVAGALVIGGDYFNTLGVQLTAGRDFLITDDVSRPPVVIVNQQFAARYLPRRAIGERVRLVAASVPGEWMTVVGIAPDIAQSRDLQQHDPILYLPFRQRPSADMWVLARSRAAPDGLAAQFRAMVTAVDPDLPLADGPLSLDDRLARNYQYRAVMATLFGLFAAIALFLASLGVYAVMAHTVSDRTVEIGIRTAMGATAVDILCMVLARGMRPMACGVLGGVAASVALGRVLRAEFAQVTTSDPAMLGAACAILVAAAVAGCVVPAQRALRVDPVTALRSGD